MLENIFYHGAGRLKLDFLHRYGSLPTFMNNGCLYVTPHRSVALDYIQLGDSGLDEVIQRLIQDFNLDEITRLDQLDLAVQLRGLIGETCLSQGSKHVADKLASIFPISRKQFRKSLEGYRSLELFAYLFTMRLNETIVDSGWGDDSMDGQGINLTRKDGSENSVGVPFKKFVRQQHDLYTVRETEICALDLVDWYDLEKVPVRLLLNFG